MKTLWILALVLAAPLAGCGVPDNLQELNVNSRYTIESVNVLGAHSEHVSDPLRTELDKFVGEKLDHSALEKLADRIKRELRVTDVKVNVSRGIEPDHVIVNFEVTKSRSQDFDLNLAKFMYDSREGFSGDVNANTNVKGNTFTFGVMSDGDSLIERFAGFRARFERKSVGTDRLQIRFEFDSFHEQWNSATVVAAAPGELYSSRQVFTPEATVVIAEPLELSFGVSFARFQVPFALGGAVAAKTESSNAVVSTLRYHQRWGSGHDEQQQEVNAAYTVRAATTVLDTDPIFNRHSVTARYKFRRGKNHIDVGFLAGVLNGTAPLYERFVLGDSTTLRGWNKFDLDPLGASHMVHGSIDYRYHFFQVFYDTGAVWDVAQEREQRQSIGTGFKVEGFQLAVAFPIRSGHVDPIFYAGMNF